MFYQSNGGREITLLNILRKCLGLTTIDVLKFRTVAACHKDLDKPHRPWSNYFFSLSRLRHVYLREQIQYLTSMHHQYIP